MKTVWVVSEESPGHVSQSTGLAEALSQIEQLNIVVVKGRATIRGWMRPFVRGIMGTHGRPLPHFILKRISNYTLPPDTPSPDVIISSGGKSVFVAKSLAEHHKVPYIFIGERKPFPAEWFHTVISPVPRESSPNSIDIELIPTPVTPQLIEGKGTAEAGTWCMILGGASRSHRFQEHDWIELAEGMNALARRENIRWLLTTSRRTGIEVEAVLQKHLDQDILADAIWWATAPRKELYAFMARAELLFVTQDSVTMVSEAVSSGKPVVVVAPETVLFSETNFLPDYYGRLEQNRRIARADAGSLKSFSPSSCSNIQPMTGSQFAELAHKVWERLGF